MFPWQPQGPKEKAEVLRIFGSIGAEMIYHFLCCILSKGTYKANLDSKVLEIVLPLKEKWQNYIARNIDTGREQNNFSH